MHFTSGSSNSGYSLKLPPHPPLNTDKLHLKYSKNYRGKWSDFITELTISPPLSVNNTSNVDVYIKTKYDYPDSIRFSVLYNPDLIITDMPATWIGPISKGDEYRATFKVKPTKTGGSKFIFFILGYKPSIEERQQYHAKRRQNKKAGKILRDGYLGYPVSFAFDESGKLYYLGRTCIDLWYLNTNRDKMKELNYAKEDDRIRVYSKPHLGK